jgi:hypothetical protein
MPSEWTEGAFPVLDPRGFYSTSGACSVSPFTPHLVGQRAAPDEMRALRRLQRESSASPFIFVSERGSPFTTAGFARMIERTAAAAGLAVVERSSNVHVDIKDVTGHPLQRSAVV